LHAEKRWRFESYRAFKRGRSAILFQIEHDRLALASAAEQQFFFA
jgi:hypothetical protein